MPALAGSSLTPELFAEDPARDSRFTVKERWIECANLAEADPRRVVEFLNRQMNEEVNGLEALARSLSDFPDTDWEIRLGLARQCADEARHAAMFRRVLEEKGGSVGEYPVLNFQYRIIANIPTLVGRFTVQNRSFEAGGIDAIEFGIEKAREDGDSALAELFEAQIADEILHVRFANEAIATLKGRDAKSLLHMGAALTAASKAFREVMGSEATAGVRYPVAAQAREEAGFRPQEIKLAGDLSEALAAGDPKRGGARRPGPLVG
jgi:rubrerythrin